MKKSKPKTSAPPDAAGAAPEGPAPNAAAQELAALQDQMLRLRADFENFRKRTAKERTEWYRRANEDLFLDLLPVLDHFELGLRNAAEQGSPPALVQGLQLVYDQLLTTLGKYGLEPVDAQGQPFDPHLHEAVSQLPSEEHSHDVVVQQTRRGYRLGEKLLRPAQVVVSKGPGPAAPAPPEPAGPPGEGEMDWGGE